MRCLPPCAHYVQRLRTLLAPPPPPIPFPGGGGGHTLFTPYFTQVVVEVDVPCLPPYFTQVLVEVDVVREVIREIAVERIVETARSPYLLASTSTYLLVRTYSPLLVRTYYLRRAPPGTVCDINGRVPPGINGRVPPGTPCHSVHPLAPHVTPFTLKVQECAQPPMTSVVCTARHPIHRRRSYLLLVLTHRRRSSWTVWSRWR